MPAPPGGSGPPPPDPPAAIVAGRYRLGAFLGRGAHGEVWAADDLVAGERVAVKVLQSVGGPVAARLRREIGALRLLRIPGVVRLIDEGYEGERPFLVMDRVLGAPFPGALPPLPEDQPRPWGDVAARVEALFEVLARVHAAGVVHRDLKPANVLVSDDGRPTVLDFGLSTGQALGGGLTVSGEILGTPAYLAPEQILGDACDGRADLYAAGVMIYEALTGGLPHEAGDLRAMLRARLVQRAPPLQDGAPGVPSGVAELIDRLLARSAADRPRSAAEVLAALRGRAPGRASDPRLPRLGGDAAVRAVVTAGLAGRSIDVAGAPGTGRTRTLHEAAEVLAASGRRVLWTRPGHRPFASLSSVVTSLDSCGDHALAQVEAAVAAEVAALLEQGSVLVADDAASVDRWTAAALERCRASGSIVRALTNDASHPAPPDRDAGAIVRTAALDEPALRPLFSGHDRLFHLREDAARALWSRTLGVPARVAEQVDAWVRDGLARWDGPALVLDRRALDGLAAGAQLAPVAPARLAATAADEPELSDLLAWLGLAGSHLGVAQLASAMRQPRWRVEAEVQELLRRALVRSLPDGRFEPLAQSEVLWPPARRREAHRAVAAAQSPGDEGRLFHLLAAGAVAQVVREAQVVGQRRAIEGRLGAAGAALAEALFAARGAGEEGRSEEAALLAEWVKVALADGTPRAMDRVLYELCRAGGGPGLDGLERMVRAAIAALDGTPEQARATAESIPPFADATLERRRHRLRVVAAGRCSLPLMEAAVRDLEAWVEGSREPLARVGLAECLGMLRYRQNRFDEAAELHAAAAAGEPWLAARAAAAVNSASALMEAFRHAEAAERAEQARDLSARCRHLYWEARAEWLSRAARYRMCALTEPDLELVSLIAQVGVPDLEAQVCLNEAAVAFRASRLDEAAGLAGRGARIWKRMGEGRASSWLIVAALEVASRGTPLLAGEARDLAERATSCDVPGIGVQVLGLLGEQDQALTVSKKRALSALARAIPRRHWHLRMDVLSVEESLARAGSPVRRPRARA